MPKITVVRIPLIGSASKSVYRGTFDCLAGVQTPQTRTTSVTTIGIAAYTIQVREKRHDEYLVLGNVPIPGGFYAALNGYLESLRQEQEPDDVNKVLQRVTQLDADQETQTHCGIVQSGDYGYAAEGIDTETLQTSYERRPQDAELLPFYFSIHAPAAYNGAVMLLQRHGPHGIYGAFSGGLRAYCEHGLPNHIVEFGRLVPATVVEQLQDGGVRAIKMTAYRVPTDMADPLRFLGNIPQPGTFSVEIKAKRDSYLRNPGWLRRARAIVLPETWGQGKVEVKVDYQGKTRTVALNDPTNVAPYIDATDEVVIDASGHPEYESIKTYCGNLMRELMQQLGRE
jgi:hypothetical protein